MQDIFEEAILPQLIESSGYVLEEKPRRTGGLTSAERTRYEELKASGVTINRSGLSSGVRKEFTELQKKLDTASTTMDRTLRKTYSNEIESIYQEKGKDSPEYKEAVKGFQQKEDATKERQANLLQTFQENSMKFLKGDFSLNAQEQKSMNELFAPTRKMVEKLYNDVDSEIGKYEGQVGDFEERAQKKLDAFQEKVTKYRDTQDKIEKDLFERGIKEYSGDISKKIMTDAVASGRDPADPEFVNQISQNIAQEAVKGGLSLEVQQMNRAQNQEQYIFEQGQNNDLTTMGMREDVFNRRVGAAEARGVANIGIEGQARDLRMSTLTGGGGITGESAQLVDAINQQRIANLGGLQGSVMGEANSLRQIRMSQPSTQGTATPSPLEVGMGLAQIGVGAYSGYTQAQGLRNIATAMG